MLNMIRLQSNRGEKKQTYGIMAISNRGQVLLLGTPSTCKVTHQEKKCDLCHGWKAF